MHRAVLEISAYCYFYMLFHLTTNCRADSRLAPSQWETSLQSNAVSHWLGANLESALDCMYAHVFSCSPPEPAVSEPEHPVLRDELRYPEWGPHAGGHVNQRQRQTSHTVLRLRRSSHQSCLYGDQCGQDGYIAQGVNQGPDSVLMG